MNLTLSAVRMLALLYRGPVSMKKLSEAAGFSTAAATGMIDRFERDGLVSRGHVSADRRVVLVEITAAGEALVEKLKEEMKVILDL